MKKRKLTYSECRSCGYEKAELVMLSIIYDKCNTITKLMDNVKLR
jgi:hypothetical protein